MKYVFLSLLVSITLLSCHGNNDNANNTADTSAANATVVTPSNIGYSVINVFPHDTSSYTEGLFLHNNFLYESTGNYGKSKLRKNDVKTGKSAQEINLDRQFFGEGISLLGNKIYQLTYQEHKVFVYDATTFKKIGQFEWPYEGWGMTTDGKELLISVGNSNIYFVNPTNFSITKTLNVSDNYGPVSMINELEYVNGAVYANIWQTNTIVKIDIASGNVTGKIDLTNINTNNGINFTPNGDAVLNGIAYNPASQTFYVTGKNWPKVFELKLQ